jgi:hypothetical protein
VEPAAEADRRGGPEGIPGPVQQGAQPGLATVVGAFGGGAPGITGTLNDMPGLALDGASSQIGSTVASGGCDAVHDHAG